MPPDDPAVTPLTTANPVRAPHEPVHADREDLNIFIFFFQAEDGIRDYKVTGVQTCALPISTFKPPLPAAVSRRRSSWARRPVPKPFSVSATSLGAISGMRRGSRDGHRHP